MNIFPENQEFLFGEAVYRNGGRYGKEMESRLELVLIYSGGAKVRSDDKIRELQPGHAAVIYNQDVIEYKYKKNDDTHIIWCETKPDYLPADSIDRLLSLPDSLPYSKRMESLLQMSLNLERGSGQNYTNLRNLLGQTAFHEFFYQANLVEEEGFLPKSVFKAKRYIEKNFVQQCSLKVISEHANMSPQHLAMLFKKHIKRTPTQYLWMLRTEKAVHLLHNTGLTVAEIAYQCGFQNPNHFSRNIKNQYGVSPSELRAKKQPSHPDND